MARDSFTGEKQLHTRGRGLFVSYVRKLLHEIEICLLITFEFDTNNKQTDIRKSTRFLSDDIVTLETFSLFSRFVKQLYYGGQREGRSTSSPIYILL